MADLAQRLWEARRSGILVEAAARRELGNLDDAYRVQEAAVQASGHARSGWKVGSTSAEARRKLGTDRPGAGALLEPFCFGNGADVPIFAAHAPAVEGEFVFVMGGGLPPRATPFGREEVLAAVMGVAGGIEVVGSRFEGGLAGLGRQGVTADFGANIAFVEGEMRPDWRDRDLRDAGVALSVDGEVLAEGTGALALGDPALVLLWLANQLRERGDGLRAGDRVTTGTCTGVAAIRPGARVLADFGPLGRVGFAAVPARAAKDASK